MPRGTRVAIALGALALLVAALAAARPVWQEALADVVQGDPGRVARALARQLAREGPRLGPVESSGAELRLPESRLRLEVLRQPPNSREPPARQAEVHVHVRVAFGAAAGSYLEACIYGRGADRRAAVEQAAAAYRTRAFPAVLALAAGDASDARPFGGTEPWGVTGRRGFAGPVFALGSASADVVRGLFSAPLFEGVTVPADGRGHLLKAVLLAQNGAWTRTVELDGDPTSVAGTAWNGAAAPAGGAMVIRFASFLQADRGDDAHAREAGLRRLGSVRATAPTTCPLDPLPDHLRAPPFEPTFCRGGRLLDCANECLDGSGTACYHAAVEVQRTPASELLAEDLFLRACQLGVASACTNAAAGFEARAPRSSGTAAECAVPAYRRACEQAGDAWGCTMLGEALAAGRGVARDLARGRAALERACAAGEDDPACVAARRLLRRLGSGPSPVP